MKQLPIITEITPEILQGSMDAHAERIAIAFQEWIHEKRYYKVRNTWYDKSGEGITDSDIKLYRQFIKEITK